MFVVSFFDTFSAYDCHPPSFIFLLFVVPLEMVDGGFIVGAHMYMCACVRTCTHIHTQAVD